MLCATSLMPVRIEAYLTGKATGVWPDALVVRVEEHDQQQPTFLLRRPGKEDVVLGDTFHGARRALYAAVRHARAGGDIG